MERNHELEALLALAQAVEAPLAPGELLERAAHSILRFDGVHRVRLWLRDEAADAPPRWRTEWDVARQRSQQRPPGGPRPTTLTRVADAGCPWRRGELLLLPVEGHALLGVWGSRRGSRLFVTGMHTVTVRSYLRERLRQQLLEKEAQRSRLMQALLRAQEEERLRISRDLHDQIGQPLSALLLSVDRLLEEGADRDGLLALKALTGETLADVRRISQALRPAQLDELGLAAALQRSARDAAQRSGLEVGVVVQLPQRLPATTETVLYRVAQEALTNVLRHAKARQASVVVTHSRGAVRLVVEDDGAGFDPLALAGETTVGIAGMRERLELLGGEFSLESTPGRGCRVHARVPL